MKKRLIEVLNSWNWILFVFILIYNVIPSIYRSYSIFLIGKKIPNMNALSIVSQWQFVQILFEIIQEAIVLPMFFFIGSKISQGKEAIAQRVKTSLSFIFLILIPLLFMFYLNVPKFVNIIGTNSNIALETLSYLRIKIWSSLFAISSIGIVITIESINKKKILISLVFLKLILSIFFDSLFFGDYTFSLQLGINGVAYSNLIVDVIFFIIAFFLILKSINMPLLAFLRLPLFKDSKLFSLIGLGSGIESLVKNVAYTFMVIRLLNLLGADQIGGYYLTMHILWSFGLVPVLAASETSKASIANSSESKKTILNILYAACIITGATMLFWIICTPFIHRILTLFNSNAEIITYSKKSYYLLIIPYILLSFNMVIDSLFYGIGKTKYMAYQAIITNGAVYFTAFLLYVLNIWTPTFTGIMILFGIGIIVDSFFTIYYAKIVLRKINEY